MERRRAAQRSEEAAAELARIQAEAAAAQRRAGEEAGLPRPLSIRVLAHSYTYSLDSLDFYLDGSMLESMPDCGKCACFFLTGE